jgi:hypothetical protein
MSWHYLQALEGESLEDICSGGEPLQPLKSKTIHDVFYCNGKLMDSYLDSLFGTMLEPLTENLGQEKLMLSAVDFHAKTFQLQEMAQDLMETEVECGEKWHGLLAKYDPNSHLWRTVQCSLLEDLNESLQTLPQWGMTVGGELYLLPTLAQNINGKESGLWLTPSTIDIPTRSVESMEKRLNYRKKIGRNGVGAGCLSEQVTWSQDGPPIGYLTKEKMFWGTPKAQDSRHALRDRGKGNLGEQVSGLHNGGKLNPLWTEWLMGWWIGWTDLKPLEMDKSHFVQQQHGES